MALTAVKFNINLAWSQSITITGFTSPKVNGSLNVAIGPTVSSTTAKEVYYVQSTLAAGASVVIDLRSITEPTFGQALVATGAYLIVVKGSGTTWRYDGHSSDPFPWFLGGTTPQINGGTDAAFAFGDTTVGAVSAGVSKVRVTNTAGSGTLTWQLAIVLKTA